ncbi:MAG: hypothetical protein DMG74_19645 [Acidobacteria bacterium]|nr:MAG: hypothetical protein DMG74_19645 [Acidobacteriota bacterium]
MVYDGVINLGWTFPPGSGPPPPPPPRHLPHCNKVVHINCGDDPEGNIERVLVPKLTDSQKAVLAAELKEQHTAKRYKGEKSANLLKQDAIHIERPEHMPSPPTIRATTRAVFDEVHALRDKLQGAEFCAIFRGKIPNLPKACARFSPDLK